MRADDLVSKSTANSARALSIAAGLTLIGKFAGRWPALPGEVHLSGAAMDWIAFALLTYLAVLHLTHWMIDAPKFHAHVREHHFFGDQPDSWDRTPIPLRGHLINARIALQGGFGYSVWTWELLLVFVLNLLLPAALTLGAVAGLVLA